MNVYACERKWWYVVVSLQHIQRGRGGERGREGEGEGEGEREFYCHNSYFCPHVWRKWHHISNKLSLKPNPIVLFRSLVM